MTQDLLNITSIRSICQEIADVYKAKMREADYDLNGLLYNFSWVTEYNGNLFELYFLLPKYWEYAEFGRPAPKDKKHPGGWPPINEILKWIQHKKLVPRPSRKIPYRPRSSTTIPSPTLLAIIIANNIRYYGTEGKHLLQQTIDETYNTLVDRLVEAITTELENEIEKDINENI